MKIKHEGTKKRNVVAPGWMLPDIDGSYVLSFSGTRSASYKTFISTTDEHVLLPTKHSFL